MENAESNNSVTVIAMGQRYSYPRERVQGDEGINYVRQRLASVNPAIATMTGTWDADQTTLTFAEASGDKGIRA